jgi:hypothetical protein
MCEAQFNELVNPATFYNHFLSALGEHRKAETLWNQTNPPCKTPDWTEAMIAVLCKTTIDILSPFQKTGEVEIQVAAKGHRDHYPRSEYLDLDMVSYNDVKLGTSLGHCRARE